MLRVTLTSGSVVGRCAEVSSKNHIPDCWYEPALDCGLPTLFARPDEAWRRFISNIKESGFLTHLLTHSMNVAYGYGLRLGFSPF